MKIRLYYLNKKRQFDFINCTCFESDVDEMVVYNNDNEILRFPYVDFVSANIK